MVLATLVRQHIRSRDLYFVLGSNFNYTELIELIDVSDGVDWAEVSIEKAHRGSSRDEFSPGRCNSARNSFGTNSTGRSSPLPLKLVTGRVRCVLMIGTY